MRIQQFSFLPVLNSAYFLDIICINHFVSWSISSPFYEFVFICSDGTHDLVLGNVVFDFINFLRTKVLELCNPFNTSFPKYISIEIIKNKNNCFVLFFLVFCFRALHFEVSDLSHNLMNNIKLTSVK